MGGRHHRSSLHMGGEGRLPPMNLSKSPHSPDSYISKAPRPVAFTIVCTSAVSAAAPPGPAIPSAHTGSSCLAGSTAPAIGAKQPPPTTRRQAAIDGFTLSASPVLPGERPRAAAVTPASPRPSTAPPFTVYLAASRGGALLKMLPGAASRGQWDAQLRKNGASLRLTLAIYVEQEPVYTRTARSEPCRYPLTVSA